MGEVTHIFRKNLVYFWNSPLLISPAAFQGLPLRSCHWYKLPPKSGLRMVTSLTQVWLKDDRKWLALHHKTVGIRFFQSLPASLKH